MIFRKPSSKFKNDKVLAQPLAPLTTELLDRSRSRSRQITAKGRLSLPIARKRRSLQFRPFQPVNWERRTSGPSSAWARWGWKHGETARSLIRKERFSRSASLVLLGVNVILPVIRAYMYDTTSKEVANRHSAYSVLLYTLGASLQDSRGAASDPHFIKRSG